MNDINAAFKKTLRLTLLILTVFCMIRLHFFTMMIFIMILLMTMIRFSALILLNISERSILRIMSAKFNYNILIMILKS